MALKRKASAEWRGTGLEGQGSLTTMSGAFQDHPYSTKLRFENEDGTAGTNPEELIAAAHAGCFNMALSFILTGAGHPPELLHTDAVLTIEKDEDGSGWTIQSVDLALTGRVPGLDSDGSCPGLRSRDPDLGPLADNGGFAPTHALLPGSPAVDSGAGCAIADQRNVPRPMDGGSGSPVCDMGAYEADAATIGDEPGPLFNPIIWVFREFSPLLEAEIARE